MGKINSLARLMANVTIAIVIPAGAIAQDVSVRNENLTVTVKQQDGSYEIADTGIGGPVLRSVVGAQVNHHWLKSNEYPKHEVSQASFDDVLGRGRQVTVMSTGFRSQPDIVYTLKLYEGHPFGRIEVEIQNHSGEQVTVESIRSVEALGLPALHLGAEDKSDRILSETFSTDVTTLRIRDLGDAPQGLHRAIWNQLIYNQETQRSFFIGALSAERFATILRLQTDGNKAAPRISSFNVDSTGTTEVLLTAEVSHLRVMPEKDRIELSLPAAPGAKIASEPLFFATGNDYHSQLEEYGEAIKRLLTPPVTSDCLLGWFSAKVYDTDITAGYIRSNAQWLSQHLRADGFSCFHIEPGYEYARGEFSTPNAASFPEGVRNISHEIMRLGFHVGGFVTPFEVGRESWVYKNHKDWLVHNAAGEPINIVNRQGGYFILDVTHPEAQAYFRQTYHTLAKEWGWHTLDVDGMDHNDIEGYHYRPGTTALEHARIALKLIREAAGHDLILIADGAPYLATAGLVEFAHISQDTNHTFAGTKEAAISTAAHYYAHRNFWINHADAFNVQAVPVPMDAVNGKLAAPLTLDEAKASIVMAAVSGGKYDIGDDLLTLGSEPDRLALVTNPDLLQMARLGRAAKPLDLMSYRCEDEQPSIFFLKEDERQSMLAVFNWTDQVRSHVLDFAQLGLRRGHNYRLFDALENDHPLDDATARGVRLDHQPARSVKLIKIIDRDQPAAAPTITAEVPEHGQIREDLRFSVQAAESGVPPLGYHWDFGDGVSVDGPQQRHTYTRTGEYEVTLSVEGLDGVAAKKSFVVTVEGLKEIPPAARYVDK